MAGLQSFNLDDFLFSYGINIRFGSATSWSNDVRLLSKIPTTWRVTPIVLYVYRGEELLGARDITAELRDPWNGIVTLLDEHNVKVIIRYIAEILAEELKVAWGADDA